MEKNKLLSRFLIFAVMIFAIIAMPTGHASAALRTCRSDPKFYLSNGDKVTVVLDIDAAESEIIYVDYVLHVPAGITLEHVVFTAGGIGQYETYSLVDDSPSNFYTVQVFVMTATSQVPVVVTMSARGTPAAEQLQLSRQVIPVTLNISGQIIDKSRK